MSPRNKACLLWDWTNTRDRPSAIDQLFATESRFTSCHNWNTWAPPELKGRLVFQPMLRTLDHVYNEEYAWVRDSPHPVVHFLNEPERQGVTPAAAAKAWRERIVPDLVVEGGRKVISPACASDQPGKDWLADFMRDLRSDGAKLPDYLGVHYYGADAEAAIVYLKEMYEKHGLPLMVTEIASISRDVEEVRHFTRRLSNWMDDTDWVIEYGFFGCMAHVADDFVSQAAQLMDENGKFTPLMRELLQRST